MQEQIRMAEERDLTNDPNSEAEEETGEKRRKQRKNCSTRQISIIA